MTLVAFTPSDMGRWRLIDERTISGAPCPLPAAGVEIVPLTHGSPKTSGEWPLRGVTSNLRYTSASERGDLQRIQAELDRPEARSAALIPIRKNPEWWALAQDERRAVIEERSHHIAIGLDYLPAIARRLYHARDLGEPFDFLTWFEFAPEHASDFDRLLTRLRASPEWAYVDRECELRLERG